MANLSQEAIWEKGIYQLETTDPVMGGPEGIDNKQAKELGNRTLFLRQRGISPWDAEINYTKDSVVVYNSVLYISLINNNLNKNPVDNKLVWSSMVDGKYLPATKSGDSYTVASQTDFVQRPMLNKSNLVALSDYISFSNSNPVMKLPDGTIIQHGMTGSLYGNTKTTITFPISFPNEVYTVISSRFGSTISTDATFIAEKVGTPTLSNFIMYVDGVNSSNSLVSRYIAIGR